MPKGLIRHTYTFHCFRNVGLRFKMCVIAKKGPFYPWGLDLFTFPLTLTSSKQPPSSPVCHPHIDAAPPATVGVYKREHQELKRPRKTSWVHYPLSRLTSSSIWKILFSITASIDGFLKDQNSMYSLSSPKVFFVFVSASQLGLKSSNFDVIIRISGCCCKNNCGRDVPSGQTRLSCV